MSRIADGRRIRIWILRLPVCRAAWQASVVRVLGSSDACQAGDSRCVVVAGSSRVCDPATPMHARPAGLPWTWAGLTRLSLGFGAPVRCRIDLLTAGRAWPGWPAGAAAQGHDLAGN